ncbi:MAG: sulfur carrier protein ThiS [bacterium]
MITVNNRDTLEWKPGMTVRDVLNEMGYIYVLIVVSVNGLLVNENEYDTWLVPDNASIRAIHIHHGG